MSVSEPESWAKLRLVQGESTAMSLELTGALGHTTLTIGQSPGCDWIVRDSGVAPVHFSLHWDGTVLRIADVYGAGGVFADGVSVGAQWRALNGQSRIEFGKASILVETLSTRFTPHSSPSSSSSLPPMPHEPKPVVARSAAPAALSTRVTLLGVAPMEAGKLQAPSARPGALPTEARSPAREVPEEPQRSHKPTLMGISSFPPTAQASAPDAVRVAEVTRSVRPEAAGAASVSPAASAAGPSGQGVMAGSTLLGIGLGAEQTGGSRRPPAYVPEGARVQEIRVFDVHGGEHTRQEARSQEARSTTSRVRPDATPSELPQVNRELEAVLRTRGATPTGRVPLADGNPETRAPQKAQVIETSGVPGRVAVGEPVVAGVSPRSAQGQAAGVPQAVLIDPHTNPASAKASSRPPSANASSEDPQGRSDGSFSSGRPPGLLESIPPRQRFPWHYVGVGLLTLVAYFAWLYLLDHL